jgi:hypothetical protein
LRYSFEFDPADPRDGGFSSDRRDDDGVRRLEPVASDVVKNAVHGRI